MSHSFEIVPTVVPETLQDVVSAKAKYPFAEALHIDVVDGIFAPNKTWLPTPGEKLPDASTFIYEAHLMVANPLSLGVLFGHAGVRRIVAHVGSFPHAESAADAFTMWRGSGVREIGIAMKLETSFETLAPYISMCDFLHVMTIAEIGVQGIPFDERGLKRVAELHARYPDKLISADGGIASTNIKDLARAGDSRFGIGSQFSKASDPEAVYRELVALLSS